MSLFDTCQVWKDCNYLYIGDKGFTSKQSGGWLRAGLHGPQLYFFRIFLISSQSPAIQTCKPYLFLSFQDTSHLHLRTYARGSFRLFGR
jgi:hypothetical protein